MLLISNFKKFVILGVLSLGVMACSSDDEGGDIITPSNTIADFVESNPNYSSLNAALIAADLKTTLGGDTSYTVFAPNNAAFNSFLSSSGFSSLNAVPVEILRQVLLNHVLPGKVVASDLATGYVETASTYSPGENNLSMYISLEDGVMINGISEVTNADIEVDNGIIHAVNTVIGLPDITTFAMADPNFEILLAALTRDENFPFVGILQTQEDPAPFTIFAPTNDAFANLLTDLNLNNLNEIPADLLASVLSYHVVAGANVRSEDITDGMEVATFETGIFTVNTPGGVTITDENERISNIVAVDVQATNGVIHVVDQVLLPASE